MLTTKTTIGRYIVFKLCTHYIKIMYYICNCMMILIRILSFHVPASFLNEQFTCPWLFLFLRCMVEFVLWGAWGLSWLIKKEMIKKKKRLSVTL